MNKRIGIWAAYDAYKAREKQGIKKTVKGPWAVLDRANTKQAQAQAKPTTTKSGPWAVLDKYNVK